MEIIALRGREDDASRRFVRSAEVFGYDYHVIDLEEYGPKTSAVKDEVKLTELKHYLDSLPQPLPSQVLVLDSHASILITSPSKLLRAAEALKADFIFIYQNETTSDDSDEEAMRSLPRASDLFRGMFATTNLLKLAIPEVPSSLSPDYTQACLSSIKGMDSSVSVIVDSESKFFQLVTRDSERISTRYEGDIAYLQNEDTHNIPVVAVAAPDAKIQFNSLGNYLARAWSPEGGCHICDEEKLDLSTIPSSELPIVQLSIFINQPTPFLEVFFERIAKLNYPKDRIHLTTHCFFEQQQKYADAFNVTHGQSYRSVKVIDAKIFEDEKSAFEEAVSLCLSDETCSYLFYVDATVQFTEPETLRHLMAANRSVIAPMVTRRGKFWSSFWGDVSDDGGYVRSNDYFSIVERTKTGIWNVPLIGSALLMKRHAAAEITSSLGEEYYLYNAISGAALEKNIFLYVDNRIHFGHLTNPENTTLEHLHNDLWELFTNPLDWEERYIHPEYHKWVSDSVKLGDFEQPCPDVFWVPLMSETFCKQLVEEMEKFGQWSDGSNYDTRLEGGYENVPTRDIHMRQVGWEEHWLTILRTYVHPLQVKLFEGYSDKVCPHSHFRFSFILTQLKRPSAPWARMNFVVRYHPNEQPFLRNHHDAATYTLDMALNRAHIDYEGGGVRFKRYNCTLVDTRVGWPLIFPGRLTHLHEGLEVTSGIRYIFVTFVNP
ncbi:unnamed protein product [Schistocephalus solidus]|uniref:Procollagen-lysine,2-oxoglutarate 5-dioxygenase 1 n=1 Tax=Schistocephalus solidus TaxID=70667 RepID=A0A183SMH1_SCHSO|nr:unnamed protein product [Schistocephalus solidus]